MRTDNVTIGELTTQMVVEAERLGYSEVSIWRNWMPRVGIVAKYYREQGLCVYDPAVTDEFLQEITERCKAGKVTENYFRKMRQIAKRLNEFYLTGTLRMDAALHGTKYVLSSSNERLVDLFIADMRTNYSREIIEMLHGAYDTQLRIFNSIIPLSIRAAETNAEGRSIYLLDPAGKVSVAYAALTWEVLA